MLISFVLPAFKAKFFKQAIDSILAQEYTNFELIIINDNSPDNIEEIVFSYNDDRIRYYKNEINIGGQNLVKQWNHCIEYAKGDYLVLAADDDIYDPLFLTRCVELINKYPSVELIRSRVKIIDENNKLIGIDGILPEFVSKYGYLYYYMIGTSFTCIGNFLFKTDVIKKKGFIDYPCAFGTDTISTIYMAENGCLNTTEMLFSFRVSSIHLSGSKSHLDKKLDAITMLFKDILSLGYTEPDNEIDKFYYKSVDSAYIKQKVKYDYYNLVIKHLPLNKLNTVSKCSLLGRKDKIIVCLRFIFDTIFK